MVIGILAVEVYLDDHYFIIERLVLCNINQCLISCKRILDSLFDFVSFRPVLDMIVEKRNNEYVYTAAAEWILKTTQDNTF